MSGNITFAEELDFDILEFDSIYNDSTSSDKNS